MASITKAQRDYAITRATSKIKGTEQLRELPKVSDEYFIEKVGLTTDRLNYDYHYQGVKRYMIANHPAFSEHNSLHEKIRVSNDKIKEVTKAKIEKATDFIMLSDAQDIAEFLKNL